MDRNSVLHTRLCTRISRRPDILRSGKVSKDQPSAGQIELPSSSWASSFSSSSCRRLSTKTAVRESGTCRGKELTRPRSNTRFFFLLIIFLYLWRYFLVLEFFLGFCFRHRHRCHKAFLDRDLPPRPVHHVNRDPHRQSGSHPQGEMERELRLRNHIRGLLLDYCRAHITEDYVTFTQDAVQTVSSISRRVPSSLGLVSDACTRPSYCPTGSNSCLWRIQIRLPSLSTQWALCLAAWTRRSSRKRNGRRTRAPLTMYGNLSILGLRR